MTKQDKWDLLGDFIDQHEFTIDDFLAVICANLLKNPETIFTTRNMIQGTEFNIRIEKK